MMYSEIEVEHILTVISEPGIKVSANYKKENEITMSLRKVYGCYELWVSADKSRMGEKYYENYTCVFLTEKQLLELRKSIDEKLNEESAFKGKLNTDECAYWEQEVKE